MAKFIPDIKNLSLDDAKDTLDKSKIKYDDENIEERYSLLTRKGHVIETAPKIGSEVKKGDVVKLTVSKLCLLPFILMMAAFIIGLIIIEKNTFSNIFKGAAPVISHTNDTWATSDLVYVSTDAKLKDGIDHYDVCILPDEDNDINKCIWFSTKTKNVEITKSGIWHTYFKGVDKSGNESKISNEIISKVDNEIPKVDSIKSKVEDDYRLIIEVETSDLYSGVEHKYFSINDGELIEFTNTIEIKNVNEKNIYNIKIIVVDKAGNIIKKNINLTNKVHDEVKRINNRSDDYSDNDNDNDNDKLNSDLDNLADLLPIIDLDEVPSNIKGASNYTLPSHYYYGNNLTGTYSCVTETGKKVQSTNELSIGQHIITCEIINELGNTANTSKQVKIELSEGDDELMDGWIRYNIYYPDNSTNWEWRLDVPDIIRTGYDTTDWQPYTGPVLIKIEDIENIYIRYELNNTTVTVPPKGRLLLDIIPDSFRVLDGQKTNVKIVFDNDAQTKEYRINGSNWITYTGPFEASQDSLIEARSTKDEIIYDAAGDYLRTDHLTASDQVYISLYTPIMNNSSSGGLNNGIYNNGSSGKNNRITPILSQYPTPNSCINGKCIEVLAGPIITSDPDVNLSDSTNVSITTLEEASQIYYKVGNNTYSLYTGPFDVNSNSIIYAYYYRKSDGKKSATSYYEIKNIRVPSMPYVKIDVSPTDYLSNTQNQVTVTISGRDYDNLEYSFDGVYYQKYTKALTITNSCTIYAKGINSNGTTIETKAIRTINPPKNNINLSVDVNVSPSSTQVQSLVNEVDVTISYDSRSTLKYYKIDKGNWIPYTGAFKLNTNSTVYAYASDGDTGYGYDYALVDYLTTGIAQPIINSNYIGNNDNKVTIKYSKNSNNSLYRINGGNWITYNGEFTVQGKATIEATNEDIFGNKASSVLVIQQQPILPNTTQILDKGDYYLIKNNYPENSEPSTREYKWKETGSWKTYNEDGWVLIKPEAKNKYDLVNMTTFEAENSKGQKVYIPKQHVYELDIPLYEMTQNIFIRFDTTPPKAPAIILSPDVDPSKEVEVSISYSNLYRIKKYKIVEPDGTDSGWLDYTGAFKISKNNTVIYAKSITSQEVNGEVASVKITNIDEISPELSFKGEFTKPLKQVNVTVIGTDNIQVDKIKYLKGNHSIDEVKDNGTFVANYKSFTVNENGIYTVYIEDKVGNVNYKTIDIANVDLSAPDIHLNVLNETFGTTLEFEADYSDSITKEYRIGKTGEWIPYTGKVTISSYDVLDKKNQDNSLRVSLKGTDEAGNTNIIDEDVYVIDLDLPSKPVITVMNDYAKLKIDGVIYNNGSIVTYDTRTDINNYYCLKDCDNDFNWHFYNGVLSIDYGTLKVKSVKKNSGLTIEETKEISLPNDALSLNAFDGLNQTKTTINSGAYRLNLDSSLWYNDIHINGAIKSGTDNGINQIKFYNSSNSVIGTTNLVGNGQLNIDILVPHGAAYLKVISGSDTNYYVTINEMFGSKTTYYEGRSILDIINTKVKNDGYYTFAVNDEVYKVHAYILNGNQTITTNTVYGDEHDVGSAEGYAKNMVVVKVNGDYTINSGVKVEPYSNAYGGPKGFLLYVTGTLTNNGTIDNSHGAYAEGQNVYLWKNSDNTYEMINKSGASGAGGIVGRNTGATGSSGTGRQTGGGGSGGAYFGNRSGSGAAGTSYSGGSGGGGGSDNGSRNCDSAKPNGGQGGVCYDGLTGGGAGNPAGPGGRGGDSNGKNGTGGLLILYSNGFSNNGIIKATGSNGGRENSAGGGSGGGSINIITNQSTGINSLNVVVDNVYNSILGSVNVNGGTSATYSGMSGGSGGKGTVNIGSIRNGKYYDLKEVISQDIEKFENSITKTGDSILSIVSNSSLTEGYWKFKVKDEIYNTHVYILNGNQTITTNTTYGDLSDCSNGTAESQMAKNMVIVKVNGDYTINSGVTVGPTYNFSYGGPKGFLLYVTGKLTNNGTIDNSHGAYAKGQNVYIWKNSDGTYEYVPAVGGAGGTSQYCNGDWCMVDGVAGTAGNHSSIPDTTLTKRATGGGGSGSEYKANGNSLGGNGTSYSGGSGGGGHINWATSTSASNYGGAGGTGADYTDYVCGGAGNPGQASGSNGTGGLLIIYADTLDNNGYLTAKGANGGANGTNHSCRGGSSGGGSINVFYTSLINQGNYNVNGGSTNRRDAIGGPGGLGTINYTQIGTPKRSLMSSMRSVRSVNPSILEDNNPIINVNDNEVTIDYKDDLTHEYSLDYGETWISYVGPFVLEENTTIIARSVDSENKVVNASTYTVTSIKKEETKSEETTTTTTTQPTTTTSVETTTTTVVTTEKVVDIPERRDEDEETNE